MTDEQEKKNLLCEQSFLRVYDTIFLLYNLILLFCATIYECTSCVRVGLCASTSRHVHVLLRSRVLTSLKRRRFFILFLVDMFLYNAGDTYTNHRTLLSRIMQNCDCDGAAVIHTPRGFTW